MDGTLQHNLMLSFHSSLHVARFYFSLFLIPSGDREEKGGIPNYHLLIFQALKSSSKGMITITIFFSHTPLQPKHLCICNFLHIVTTYCGESGLHTALVLSPKCCRLPAYPPKRTSYMYHTLFKPFCMLQM